MENYKLFPTLIGTEVNVELADKLLPYAKKYLSDESKLTNHWNYTTTYKKSSGQEIETEIDFFTNYIQNLGNKFLNENGYESIKFKPQIFFSAMRENDFHGKHFHANCILSGVFYLQVPINSSSIKFYDSRIHHRCINLEIKNPNENNWVWYSIAPKKGMFLIWNSWLEHEVLPNESDDERITAVFNLMRE